MKQEENPFEDKRIAKEWITHVEEVRGETRDNDIYPRIQSWVKKIKPKVLVEIGCGQGVCSKVINNFKGKYIGVEPSEYLLQRAKELYKNKSNRTFILGNAYKLPLDNQIADAVLSVNVWFHLKDLDQASEELARILKSKGKFLIITAHPDSYNIWESFFSNYKKDKEKIVGKVAIPVNSLSKNIFYLHTLDKIIEALKKHGLIIESTEGFGYTKEYKDQGLFISIEGHR